MPLLSATLASELKAMSLFDNEPDAINAWAESFSSYFSGATSNGVPISPAAIPPAEANMKLEMVGLSTAGATAIQAGITAFWNTLVTNVVNPVTMPWATVTVIAPPVLLTGISVALTAVFVANVAGSLTKDAALDAIATAIHTNNLGGLATWPLPLGPTGIM